MSERVEFEADGITLVGDLRVPDGRGPRPALVLSGPFTGTRGQVAGRYAEGLTGAGYVTLAFDHRNWGESGGTPRGHEDPQGKLRDLRAAVSLLRSRPEVDGGRIGAVGVGLGAGYALRFAALDPRVGAFAGVAGSYGNPYGTRAAMGAGYREALARHAEIVERQDRGGPVEYLPAVAEEGEAAMPGPELFAYYGTERGACPHWRNEVTRASLGELLTVDDMTGADFLSPTPGLVVHGVIDRLCSPEGAEEVYRRMEEPKRLVWLDTRQHTDLYDVEPRVTRAVEAVAEFLAEHL
ncbi:alpha/beta hydrolase [Streptosporangium saharense]|uniref:alpha/beta hydrolase n=1 Tax=Streptosporangium saharense TaxID=1706840 RepID=UPI003692C359